MAAFLYRCPSTGLLVQAFIECAVFKTDRTFQVVPCNACGGVHWSIQEPAKQPAIMKKIEIIDLSLED